MYTTCPQLPVCSSCTGLIGQLHCVCACCPAAALDSSGARRLLRDTSTGVCRPDGGAARCHCIQTCQFFNTQQHLLRRKCCHQPPTPFACQQPAHLTILCSWPPLLPFLAAWAGRRSLLQFSFPPCPSFPAFPPIPLTTSFTPTGTLTTGSFTSGPGTFSSSSSTSEGRTQTTTSQGGSPPVTTTSSG